MQKIPCACGCGTLINEFDKKNRKRKYILGHHHKGESNWWKKKNVVKERTSHIRANKICPKIKCFINNEQCSKRLETAHKNRNPFDNSLENLVCLCGSHHRLMDLGNIPFEKLSEIRYYKISSGSRRYTASQREWMWTQEEITLLKKLIPVPLPRNKIDWKMMMFALPKKSFYGILRKSYNLNLIIKTRMKVKL
jgi:hypothetical protein